MRSRKFMCAAAAFTAAGVAGAEFAEAAPFTSGNLLVTRAVGGTGSYNTLTGDMTVPAALAGGGGAATVVIDEYTTAGVLVQSIAMPNVQVPQAAPAGNRALVYSGTQNQEGAITMSKDGQRFVIVGYNQTAGVAGTNNAQSTAVERVVGLIDLNGNVNTTTALRDSGTAQSVRSAYSTNGTDIWIGGINGGNVTVDQGSGPVTYTSGGVRHTTVGSTFSTQITTNSNGGNYRILNGFNNQLYISNNANTAALRGVHTVGTGFPTSPTFNPGNLAPFAQLPGFNAATAPTPSNETADDYWFMDANTLYIADQRNGATGSGNNDAANGGVQKWVFTDTNADLALDTWVFQYNVPLGTQVGPTTGGNVGAHGLAGMIDPLSGDPVLFVTTFDGAGGNQNRLYKLIDDGTQAGFASSLTLLATSPLQTGGFATAFRGVEIVPEPTSSLVALGALGGLALRRRRRSSTPQ